MSNVRANEIGVKFSNTNIEEAIKKASVEGKLIFASFHADWCAPCKWMDQNTYTNPNVVNALNSSYVALKVNIDEIKGYELKKTYEVKYLPTLLIFNAQGQIIDRIEETLSPRLLMEVLNKNKFPENQKAIKHSLNISPSLAANTRQVKDDNVDPKPKDEYVKYYQEKQTNSAFRVQVGVYSSYEDANEMINSLRSQMLEPIDMVTEIRKEIVIFKVRVGQFDTYDEAEQFRIQMVKDINLDGIVK